MKTKLFPYFLCITLFACKKNESTTITHLKKMITKWSPTTTTTDSIQYTYSYDDNIRLIKLIINTPASAVETVIYTRNSSGYITGLIVNGNSSYKVINTGASGHFLSSVTTYAIDQKDSATFTYIGDKITQAIIYYNGGTGFRIYSKQVYTYDSNGNISKWESFNFNGTSFVLALRRAYSYDTKVSPLQLGNEVLLFSSQVNGLDGTANDFFIGPNNMLSKIYEDLNDPFNNRNTTFTYTYNNNNEPIIATGTGTQPSTLTTYLY